MAWKAGERRREIAAADFVSSCLKLITAVQAAKACGVSSRTIRRWKSGEDFASLKAMEALADCMCVDRQCSVPIYRPSMCIDGNTRVLGVGDYSLRSARGIQND